MSRSIKASVGGNQYKKKNHFKLTDGDVVFRIVPPMTKFTKDPRGWMRYHSVLFGYKNLEGKHRPFESCLEGTYDSTAKVFTVKTPDAAVDRLNDLKAKLEQAKLDGNGPLVAKLNTLVGFKGVYSVDKNYHMNVIGLDGSIGELKIRKTAKLALEAEIKRLNAEGTDPLSEEDGRFFVFHRDGMSKETNFKVSVYTVKVDLPNGKKANEEVSHKITPELWDRLETEAFDLNDLFPKPTSEEVAKIVATSDLLSGKSPACNEIFDNRWKAKRDAKAEPVSPDEDYSEFPDTAQATTPVQAILRESTPNPVPVTPKLAVNAPATTVVHTAAPVAKAATSVDEMSDDDFFAQIGVQTG